MAEFEFSKFDGSQEFTPQSADRLFDEFAKHLLDYGSQMMEYLNEWEDEHPDVVDLLLKRGYVEQDADGQYVVTPKGLRRVENRALEELFDVSRKGQFGKHDRILALMLLWSCRLSYWVAYRGMSPQ